MLEKVAATTVALIVFSTAALAQGPAVHRPIQEFIAAQGTTEWFTPPVKDQFGWSSPVAGKIWKFAVFDYAGKANNYLQENTDLDLGTTMDGDVTVRPLADGRAEVHVNLHTKNALTWMTTFNEDGEGSQFNENPLLFGYRALDLKNNPSLRPGLGDSHMSATFKIATPDARLPDLVCINRGDCPAGFELIALSFNGTATGPLRAPAGLGPEGSSGRCFAIQTGLFLRGEQPGNAPRFPGEIVELRRIAK